MGILEVFYCFSAWVDLSKGNVFLELYANMCVCMSAFLLTPDSKMNNLFVAFDPYKVQWPYLLCYSFGQALSDDIMSCFSCILIPIMALYIKTLMHL